MTLYRWFKFKDEEAVSEVVGTILTLGITVVLFSSVYATVTTLEAPERRDHVEMVAVYEREGDIDYINITHQSGRSLDIGSLSFNLLADPATENRLGIDDEEVNFDDDTWSVGEEVRIEGEIFEHDDTELELLIRNEDTHRIVHQTVLAEEVPDQLDIGNTYISYIYDWRNYAEQDEEITIVAVLSDIGDIDAEDINVTASVTGGHNPFKDVETVTLTSDSRRDRYNETVEIASQAREKSYSVRIRAEFEENSTEEYVRLNVGERPAERYPRELEIGRINYFPSSPSHGDGLEVTVEVYNQGPENFTTDWNMTDHYKEQDPEGAEGTTTFLHGPAPTEISGEWDIKGSGRHEIEIEIEGDEEWEGAKRSFEIYVDPHVLIVEDRSAAELPEMELMGNALDGLNLDHETRSLGEYDDEEDIEIDYERHSVIIWLTGNKTEGEKTSLLGEAADDLADYIEEDNGTVWLKGSNLD
ncbi:MAG: type IV pilin, partial [Candidatus Natronoplasma sp.]